MKRLTIAAAAFVSLISAPAYAGEGGAGVGRIETNIGIIDEGGESEAVGALVLGYDWDLNETLFVGAEASLEKVFARDTAASLALGARAGAKVGEETKVFVIGGYAFEKEEDRPFVGAGIEQGVAERIYVTAFYHRLFSDGPHDADVYGIGIGLEF